MKLFKIIVIATIGLFLSGCDTKKEIDVLNDMSELSIEYTVALVFQELTEESVNCTFEIDYYECGDVEDLLTSDSEDADELERSMIHLFLDPSDFEEIDGAYFMTDDGKREFVQRIPYFEQLMDTGLYTTEEAITEALDGLGDVKITLSNNQIDTLELFNDNDELMLTFTFDFE